MNANDGQALSAHLLYIGLGSPDPARLAQFHGEVMGLTVRDTPEGLLGQGPSRQLFFVPGEAKTLAFAGFAVADSADLTALEVRLRAAGAAFSVKSDGTHLLQPGALEVIDPDGNRIAFGVARVPDPKGQPGLPARLQHIVVASRNAAALASFYEAVLGFKLSDIVLDDARNLTTAFLRCSEDHHSFAVFQAPMDRFDHHCYEAGDWGLIRDWGDHFASHDVKVQWGPGRHGPGNNLFLFIHDSDGNWLEISAELEQVTPDRSTGVWPHAEKTLNSWGYAPMRS